MTKVRTPHPVPATPILLLLLAVAAVVLPRAANAFPSILDTFLSTYSKEATGPFGTCQVCHEQTTGGDGWNPYGWRVRQNVLGGETVPDALRFAEVPDSDMDAAAARNLTEIEFGTHPGWADRPDNLIIYKSGASNLIPPPATIANIDPPPPLEDPIAGTITVGAIATLQTVATGFTSPIHGVPAPGVTGQLFVADQNGVISRVDLSTGNKVEFLNVSAQLVSLNQNYDERGLLGLAFHPDFATNGRFYTYQSEPVNGTADFPAAGANHQSVVAEWTVSPIGDPDGLGDLSSKRVVLRIDQPYSNHNGGGLAFDQNNLLYIALGDGGSADDPDQNGLNANTALGSFLRIDPLGNTSANGQYSVPGSNPFVGDASKLDEIYAYGFRNPFSFSFDSANGELIAGDVGQNDVEEIDKVESGRNYGWNAKEGSFYFYPNGISSGYVSDVPSPTSTPDMIDPVLQYDHDEGISVVGGFVYRGQQIAALRGTYVFGDFGGTASEGRLFYSQDMQNVEEFDIAGASGLGMFLTGFGQDHDGELYILGKTQLGPSGTTGLLLKLTAVDEMSVTDDGFCVVVPLDDGKAALICL